MSQKDRIKLKVDGTFSWKVRIGIYLAYLCLLRIDIFRCVSISWHEKYIDLERSS